MGFAFTEEASLRSYGVVERSGAGRPMADRESDCLLIHNFIQILSLHIYRPPTVAVPGSCERDIIFMLNSSSNRVALLVTRNGKDACSKFAAKGIPHHH
jgi:hypothetical protein